MVYLAPLKILAFFIEELKRSGTTKKVEAVLDHSWKSWTPTEHTTSQTTL
jgi:hypothetical protein